MTGSTIITQGLGGQSLAISGLAEPGTYEEPEPAEVLTRDAGDIVVYTGIGDIVVYTGIGEITIY